MPSKGVARTSPKLKTPSPVSAARERSTARLYLVGFERGVCVGCVCVCVIRWGWCGCYMGAPGLQIALWPPRRRARGFVLS